MRRCALAAVVIFVFAVSLKQGWWDVIGWWWHRRLDPNHELLGATLPTWGRLGKMMQFVAGLPVILDILGPLALAAAAESRERRSRAVLKGVDTIAEPANLANMWERVFASLIGQQPLPPPLEGTRFLLATESAPSIGEATGVDQDDFESWMRQTRVSLREAHACAPHDNPPCQEQWTFARNQTDSFLRARLSEEDLSSYDQITDTSTEMDITQGTLQVWLLLLGISLFMFFPFIVAAVAGALFFVAALLVPVVIQDETGFRLALMARLGPSILFNRVLAVVLRRFTNKGLRWVAVAMFVVGSGLDLIAS